MLPKCHDLSKYFRTVFVFALGPFLPMVINFFDFNGNFNGKMPKKLKWPKITFPGSKMVPKVSKWGFTNTPPKTPI